MNLRLLIFMPLLLVPFAETSSRPINACAPAPQRGVTVDIASESAIIIWDEKTNTQHFIRRATFSTSATGETKVTDFGFLVPTPSKPKVTEAEDKAFDALSEITSPAIEMRARPSDTGCGIGCASAVKRDEAATSVGEKVEVLEQGQVGNFNYEILKSNDPLALTDWLNDNKYEIRPALTRWMDPYVRKGWIITAFKIAKDSKSTGAAAKAVRMSFEAKEPIFPYREPDDMGEAKGKRMLRVYFIGEGKASALAGTANWVARIAWADRPSESQWKTLLPHLNLPGLELNNWWLTEFEDPSSPRAGNVDVAFNTKGSDQTPTKRPPKIIYTSSNSGAMPTYLGFAAIVACLYCVRALRFIVR